MAKKKPPVLHHFLRLRSYPDRKFVSVWLIARHVPAKKSKDAVESEAGLLWGEMLPDVAERVVSLLGLPVEREDCPAEVEALTPKGCATVARQGELFG